MIITRHPLRSVEAKSHLKNNCQSCLKRKPGMGGGDGDGAQKKPWSSQLLVARCTCTSIVCVTPFNVHPVGNIGIAKGSGTRALNSVQHSRTNKPQSSSTLFRFWKCALGCSGLNPGSCTNVFLVHQTGNYGWTVVEVFLCFHNCLLL